jgi:hypothetical protein
LPFRFLPHWHKTCSTITRTRFLCTHSIHRALLFVSTHLYPAVPLTAVKAGSPSSKRAKAALEGVASKKIKALLPVQLIGMCDGGGEGRRSEGRSEGRSGLLSVLSNKHSVCEGGNMCVDASISVGSMVSSSVCHNSIPRMSTKGRRIVSPALFE